NEINKEGCAMRFSDFRTVSISALMVAGLCAAWGATSGAQSGPPQAPAPQAAPAQPSPGQPAQPQQGQQPQAQQSQDQQQPGYVISMTVPVVNVDVVVTDNDGNYLSGLKKENFRILEDGKPQTVTNFATGDAPITV